MAISEQNIIVAVTNLGSCAGSVGEFDLTVELDGSPAMVTFLGRRGSL
ncbi:MAG: hypothetical protein ACFCGT_18540 [Sandaracinaceae bacterium]